jgi:DNA-binding CsgD family transcriptional regulator
LTVSSVRGVMECQGPFVGRVEELRLVSDVLADEAAQGVVLAGASGVGKTRLAREVLAFAERMDWASFWVSASTAVSTIPFAAVAPLIPVHAGSDRLELLRCAGDWLSAAADGRRVLVGVDDAHVLDEASAALIHQLSSSRAAFVVVTVRSGEPAPGPITALWKDGLAHRVELQPLSRTETSVLVEGLLDGPADEITREQLWRLSRGNALYLREFLRDGVASGALTSHGGVWCWSGRIVAAPLLAELISARVGAQPAEIKSLLDMLAFGEPLTVAMLRRAGTDPSVIEAAEVAGLARTESGPSDIEVRLAHPMFGEVARTTASPLHRREVSRRLAEAASEDGDPVRVAVWHLDGAVPIDSALLMTCAHRALAALDLRLADRSARAAVDAGGGLNAERLLATLHVLCGDAVEAEALLGRLDARDLPDVVRAELAAARAWNLTFALGRPGDAERVLHAAGLSVTDGWELLDCQRANLLGYAGRLAEGVAVAARVLDRPALGESGNDDARVQALTLTCQLLSVAGQVEESVRLGERAIALYKRLHGEDWAMMHDESLGALAGVLVFAGRLEEAQALVDDGCARSARAGWAAGAAMWFGWRADVALARGWPATSLRHLRGAAALIEVSAHPYNGFVNRFLALLHAKAAAQLGAADDAARALRAADLLARPWTSVLDVWGGSSAAWVAAARGEIASAVDLALEAARDARAAGQFGWEVLACHQVVRFGVPGRVIKRMVELGGLVDGALAPLYLRHAAALFAEDGPGLDSVASGFAELGYLLLAAEAAAQAARAHRTDGRPGRALASRMRAGELARRCERAHTPALASLVEPSGLTARETQIARLAARGLTNPVIAEELVISVRTVDNTLHQL